MNLEFKMNGNNYLLKEVTRRKPAKCKVCGNVINPKEKAKVLMGEGFMGLLDYCVGVFHSDCYPKFKFEGYVIPKNNQVWG